MVARRRVEAYGRRRMGQKPRFQETLRRLAMIDEGFVEEQAGCGLGLTGTPALDPRTAALLQIAASVAIGSPAVCLQWCASRALGISRCRAVLRSRDLGLLDQ
jgi:hypothetical protein